MSIRPHNKADFFTQYSVFQVLEYTVKTHYNLGLASLFPKLSFKDYCTQHIYSELFSTIALGKKRRREKKV